MGFEGSNPSVSANQHCYKLLFLLDKTAPANYAGGGFSYFGLRFGLQFGLHTRHSLNMAALSEITKARQDG